jgi:hypothetical protein
LNLTGLLDDDLSQEIAAFAPTQQFQAANAERVDFAAQD